MWTCIKKNSLNTDIHVRYKTAADELTIAVNKWRANAEIINLLNYRNNNSIYNYFNKKLSSPAKLSYLIKKLSSPAKLSYLIKKLSSPAKLSYLINHHGNTITEDAMIAQELNNYFSSVYVSDDEVIPPFP